MLLPYLPILNKKKVILGSQSKTRNELMKSQLLVYERVASTFPEDLSKAAFESVEAYNVATCRGKVQELVNRFKQQGKEWDLLICGDTILSHKGQVIEKPENEEHCIKMMSSLAKEKHETYTAHVVVFNTEPQIRYEWVTRSQVTFGDIPLESLQAFAKTEEPYIHSGGYQLTAISGSFLQSINGSHSSVQGLDMYELSRKIIEGSRKAGWIY